MRSTKVVALRQASLLQNPARGCIFSSQLIQLMGPPPRRGHHAGTRLISLSHNPVSATDPHRPATFFCGGGRDAGGESPASLFLRGFFLSCQKETPQTPKAANVYVYLFAVRLSNRNVPINRAAGNYLQAQPGFASLAPLSKQKLKASPAVQGRWRLRSRRRRVLEICASYQRTADLRHPSGRACARPPPLQVGEAFASRKAKAEERELLGFSVISFCKLHRRPGRRHLPPYRSLVFGQDQRNGVARGPCGHQPPYSQI